MTKNQVLKHLKDMKALYKQMGEKLRQAQAELTDAKSEIKSLKKAAKRKRNFFRD